MTADLMIAMMKKVAPNFDQLVPTISKGFSYKPQAQTASRSPGRLRTTSQVATATRS